MNEKEEEMSEFESKFCKILNCIFEKGKGEKKLIFDRKGFFLMYVRTPF